MPPHNDTQYPPNKSQPSLNEAQPPHNDTQYPLNKSQTSLNKSQPPHNDTQYPLNKSQKFNESRQRITALLFR